jgi:hypothetical protein
VSLNDEGNDVEIGTPGKLAEQWKCIEFGLGNLEKCISL